MALLPQYVTFYGIMHAHITEVWNSASYEELLVSGFRSTDEEFTDTTAATDITFLYPIKFLNEYYVDGYVDGFFAVFNNHASASQDLDSYIVTLSTVDDTGTTGAIGEMTNTLSASKAVAAQGYLTVPIYFEVEDKDILKDHKLLLKLEIDGGADLEFYHPNDSSDIGVQIEIPFATTG